MPTSPAPWAANGWADILLFTPFSSWITQVLGRQPVPGLTAAIPAPASPGFALTDDLVTWFVLQLLAGAASGLRWVLAETAPKGQRGRYVGLFETRDETTFVIGPAALVWVGPTNPAALWVAIGFITAGLFWTFLVPDKPPPADAVTSPVVIRGVWHARVRHPIIMLAGFIGGGIADRLVNEAAGCHALMAALTLVTLAATIASPMDAHVVWLAWPVVFLWGGAGGSLYPLAMIDIGSGEQGVTLVYSTAVLVIAYTFGSMAASATFGVLLQWSASFRFPATLASVAAH